MSLPQRKRLIVEQIVRDRIATNESIRQGHFARLHPTSVTRITSDLVCQGWLSAYPLSYPTKYFRAGKRAISAYGLSESRSLPLGPQALPTEFGLLEYTSRHAESVLRATSSELTQLYPWYSKNWQATPHCIRRANEKLWLELIRVDLGGPVDHIARKCRDDIETRCVNHHFRALIKERGFCLVLITGSLEKSAEIQRSLRSIDWPEGMSFRLAEFVSLLPLLPRIV